MRKPLTFLLVGCALTAISLALLWGWPRENELGTKPAPPTQRVDAPEQPSKPEWTASSIQPSSNAEPLISQPPTTSARRQSIQQRREEIEVSNQASKPAAQEMTSPSLILKKIQFNGVKTFSPESMQALVAKFIGTPLQMDNLPEIAVVVEDFYRVNNYVARVIMSQQDLDKGLLVLDVMESSLSKEKVDQQLSELTPLTQSASSSIKESANPAMADQNSTDKPERNVQRQLSDAQVESDVILQMYKDHTRQSELILNNHGEQAYGRETLQARFSLFNTWLPSDQLDLSALLSRGYEIFRSQFNAPVGKSGWTMGLSLSAMDYKVLEGSSTELGQTGKAFTQAISMDLPLSTNFDSNSQLHLKAQTGQYTHLTSTGYSLSAYDTEALVAEFSGVDRHFAKTTGTLTYAIQWNLGQVHIETASPDAFDDQGGRSTAGAFQKIRTNLTFIEPWTPNAEMYIGWTSQLANQNLPYSEKLQVSGPLGIRAYPFGNDPASNGQILNLEMRYRLENGVVMTGFYDWGLVTDLVQPDPTKTATLPNSYDLKGYGLSAAYQFQNGASIQATWARRDGHDPREGDLDHRHSTDRNRYWLQLRIPF